jgi:hypothetical protein
MSESTIKNFDCAALANEARNIAIEKQNLRRQAEANSDRVNRFDPQEMRKVPSAILPTDVQWRGLYKLQEEMNELGQVLMKLAAFPDGQYPTGDGGHRPLLVDLLEEMSDVVATLNHFRETNGIPLLHERIAVKREKFRVWGLKGVTPDDTTGEA